VTLVGKNYSGYGEFLNENFVKLLENSASAEPPAAPLPGELWYDLSVNTLKVYVGNNEFKDLASSTATDTAPGAPADGDLWWDNNGQQLKIWDSATNTWVVIGPTYTSETGVTGAITTVITDTLGNEHVVLMMYVADQVVAILSKDPTFTPSPAIAGFATIKPGLNFATISGGEAPEIEGTVTQARKLIDPNNQDAVTTAAASVTVLKNLLPDTNNTKTLGSSSLRWSTVFATTFNGTTFSGSGASLTSLNASNLSDGTVPDGRISGSYTGLGNLTPSTNNTSNLGSSSLRWSTVFATTFNGTATTALYADLAERFVADQDYPPGTVVKLGGSVEITECTEDASEEVFGVVSTDPAYLMNTAIEGLPVALIGRVPVRVTGTIKRGDRLISAGSGVARAATEGELTLFNIIGRALEDKTTADEGVIEAVVAVK
jgi:hypothetical protein